MAKLPTTPTVIETFKANNTVYVALYNSIDERIYIRDYNGVTIMSCDVDGFVRVAVHGELGKICLEIVDEKFVWVFHSSLISRKFEFKPEDGFVTAIVTTAIWYIEYIKEKM